MSYWAKTPRIREQMVLFSPSLDEAIPEDHPVRLFDLLLDECDWSAWEAEYHGSRGQPPIHPRYVAGVILYGLTRRIRSSRMLEYMLTHNIDFMWLASGHEIDHSTLCGFRTKFREPLKDLFRQMARVAIAMGVARLNEVALDGTRVKSNNGRSATQTSEGVRAKLAALDKELEKMLQEAEAEDAKLFDTGASSQQLPKELASAQARKKQLQDALNKLEAAEKARRAEGINPRKNPPQLPTTDSDSRVLPNKEGGYAPNYTPMATTDVHGGFILDTDVISSTCEQLVTLPAMDRIQADFGAYPEVALADGIHATGANIEGMEERGIEFFSPLGSPGSEAPNPALREDPTIPVEESEKGNLPRNPQTKKFDKSAFVYDADSDVWHCPQGRTLEYAETKSKLDAEGNRTYFKVYRSPDCGGCPWQADCRSQKSKRGRTVSRDQYAESREQFVEKMGQPESKERYKNRFHAAETPFGIIKEIMALRQFLLRGLEKVRTEWLWACTAFNLQKLVREIARLRAKFSRLMAEGEA